jgi:uncharacterized membrane protein YsdA (DUF1294 family)
VSRPALEKAGLGWSLVALSALAGLYVAWRGQPTWHAMGLHLVVLSLFAFLLFAWDKRRAAAAGRRVSEANLWIVTLSGGAPGGAIAMALLRHKTRRLAFRLCVPAAAALHVAGLIALGVTG